MRILLANLTKLGHEEEECNIGAQEGMHKAKQKEPSEVSSADTLVYPEAMVVELVDTEVAHLAMLRPGWLD